MNRDFALLSSGRSGGFSFGDAGFFGVFFEILSADFADFADFFVNLRISAIFLKFWLVFWDFFVFLRENGGVFEFF